ncbi:hypothetical protein I317_07418 [Kwoniella heveanensis CBS 569]|nr:hypothetical protein I317_07418 [Kwoniella heveanensis CBS 569]
MKRSPSPSSLSPETASNTPDPIDIKPLNLEAKTPLITPKKAGGVGSIKSAKTTATSAKSPKKKVKKEETTATGFDENGTWNAEKRALFMDTIIAAGYMAVDLKELANKASPWYDPAATAKSAPAWSTQLQSQGS